MSAAPSLDENGVRRMSGRDDMPPFSHGRAFQHGAQINLWCAQMLAMSFQGGLVCIPFIFVDTWAVVRLFPCL